MQQIHHKKNKQGIIEFTNSFESQYLYLEKLDAEVLFELSMRVNNNTVFIPSPCTISGTTLHYIRECWQDNCPDSSFVFLDDITPNLSKYTPEDNVVLFLSEEDMLYFNNIGFYRITHERLIKDDGFPFKVENPVHILIKYGTQSEIQKGNEVAKELREKYGVEEVNVVVLHWFTFKEALQTAKLPSTLQVFKDTAPKQVIEVCERDGWDVVYRGLKQRDYPINKIITTNSTGILPVENNERLQVIDCKEIFEEYLKENN